MTRRYHFVQADVFTDQPFGGNQLAVFTDARGLTEAEMQTLAREMNYSESAFVLPPEIPGVAKRVRIFTPAIELPMAGHPTVGATFVLAHRGEIPLTGPSTNVILQLKIGPTPVTIEADAWNEAGAAIKITIAPPFWKALWFYCLAFGALVATIVLAHNQRVRARIKRALEIERLRRQESERVRKKAAEDFHDELGHRLTKIALFSEFIKRKLNGAAAEIHEYLDKIIDDSHRLTNDTRDFIWTLDPAKDSLYEVMAHLKEFGDELFDRTAIAFRVIGISDELEKVKFAMEARRQFTLIFKEGMNNALKHAECKNVLLTVEVNGENLRITLSDDGKGYNGNTNGPGHGLKNMQMRAEKMQGALQLISQPEGGATIELTAKVIGLKT